MSIYGHYTQQYYGNKIDFPENSFLISGISFYSEHCTDITYDTELIMKPEPNNKYDKFAISVNNDTKQIGYVPNNQQIKELCKEYITEPLKILNIKFVKGSYGIRVIPKCFYTYDKTLESEVFFSD